MKRYLVLAAAVAIGICAHDAQAADPFAKAGLKKNTGRVLTSSQAGKVRGGFRGEFGSVLEALGVDRSQGWEGVRAQLQSLGRDAIQAKTAELGITVGQHSGARAQRNTGNRETLLAALGIDSSLSKAEIRSQLQSIGRENIRAAAQASGITNGQRAGSRNRSRIQGRR